MNTKPEHQSNKRLKKNLIVLLIALLAFSFFTPRSVDYSDNPFIRATPGIINLLAAPTIVVILLNLQKGYFKAYFILYGLLTFMLTTTVSGFIRFKIQSDELKTNGVNGKAIITGLKPGLRLNQVYWIVKCSYVANKHRYEVQFRTDRENTHKLGDTLQIVYNKDFPKMYRLTEIY